MKQVITTEKIPIKLWADDIEDGALAQAKNLANLPFAYKHIAVMPDVHQGYGMPIGGVMAAQGIVSPNCVGVDIGCGMTAIKSDLCLSTISICGGDIDEILKEWMGKIREQIPVGFSHNIKPQENEVFNLAPDIPIIQQELESAKKQLGTLGGGNHFIEIQKDEDGYIWIMVHSGSRNLGYKTARVYNDKAKELCAQWFSNIPTTDLAFLPINTLEAQEYIQAMQFCLDFAYTNRSYIMGKIMLIIGVEHFTDKSLPKIINIHHNYATWENHFGKNVLIHRKGATLARKGTIGIVPGSMGTNSYIVEGLGNEQSFNSCSHGAGRKMGRKQATRELNLEEEQAQMKGIIGAPRNVDDLDEAPGAYKPIDEVMENQKDLVKILTKLTPLAVIKG